MDKKQVKTVLTGDFSGIDNFIENIIYPIFGEECFEKKDVPEQLVTSESKAAADIANVSSILNIGTISNIKSEDIELFDVTLKNTSDISRSRVGIQRLIRSALSQYSHAFIVFHYKDCENKEWRFSYLHKEGTLKNTTSAKRYTYVFGNEHNPRTATERFEILANSKKTDDDLINAFSVEALSKEFFDKYEELYNSFVEYMIITPAMQKSFKTVIAKYDTGDDENDVEEIYKTKYKPLRDYVKKMMGRLVFLYFLERKGWLNGDKKYLTKLFDETSEKKDFLDNVLEPLFFGVLNTPQRMRSEKFKEMGWSTAAIPGLSSIPYLNGGLFEQDELDKRDAKFPEDYFEKLFDFFSEYNFTVDENDPNDEEMGIDPEMLSVIFESLLEDNKGKGAFYTPKEEVLYMCSESIIAYLSEKSGIKEKIIRKFIENLDDENIPEEIEENKRLLLKLIENVKICDPAIGSGAFPMGMLNLLLRIRLALYPRKNKDANEIARLKKDIIQNNIYGVDIEKGAIDIARLRFWLSIVVNSDEPEPLPNFDYKFMQGNSLISTFDGHYVEMSLDNTKTGKGERVSAGVTVQKNLNELVDLRQEFYSLSGKDKYNKEIEIKKLTLDTLKSIFSAELASLKENPYEQLSLGFAGGLNAKAQKEFDEIKRQQKEISSLIKKIDELATALYYSGATYAERAKTDINFFDWKFCFSDVVMDRGGFDIVIGNPPYIQLQKDGGKLAAMYEKCGFSSFAKTGDIYCLFYEKALQLLSDDGLCCFITSNKWMRAAYGEKLRELFANHTNPRILIDFAGVKVFDSATVDTNILLYQKTENKHKTVACVTKNMSKDDLKKLSVYVQQNSTDMNFNNSDSWVILSSLEQTIKQKIEKIGKPLKNWNITINYGIKTGFNDAFIISSETRKEILSKCANEDERKRTDAIIRPILRGRDIQRYTYVNNGLWLINTHNGMKGKLPKINIDEYPAIKTHLDRYWDKISTRADKGDTPYNLRNCAYLDDFDKPKIIYPETTVGRSQFYYDDSKFMLDKTCFFISGEKLKFLEGMLTSKIIEWYLERMCRLLGKRTIQYSKQWIEDIPIASPNEKQEKDVVEIVDEITDNIKNDSAESQQKINLLIKKLNAKIGEIYNLNEQELDFIGVR